MGLINQEQYSILNKNIVVIKVYILAVQISKVPNFSFSFANTLGIRSSIRTRKTSKQTNVFI